MSINKLIVLMAIFILSLFYSTMGAMLLNQPPKQNETDTTYSENGNIKSIIEYKNNVPEGAYRIMFQDGTVFEYGDWFRGHNIGLMYRYYDNGNRSQIFSFNPIGQRTSVQKYFHKNGVLAIELNMRDGIKIDMIQYWDNEGQRTKTIIMQDGVAIEFIYY